MAQTINMWNIHDWLSKKQLSHSFCIKSTKASIKGVLLQSGKAPLDGYAVVSNGAEDSQYSAVLSYQEDCLFFYYSTALEVMSEINLMFSRLSSWEQKLNRVNLSHGTLTSLLNVFNEYFPYPVTIHHGDTLMASSSGFDGISDHCWENFNRLSLHQLLKMLPVDSQSYKNYTSEEPVIFDSPLYKDQQILFTNVRSPRHQTIRITAYAYQEMFSPGALLLMDFFAKTVSKNLLLHTSLYTRRLLSPDSFFSDYLRTKEWQGAQVPMILKQLRWKNDDLFTIFRIELRASENSILLDTLYRTIHDTCPSCICILYQRAVHLICNYRLVPAESVLDILKKQIPEYAFVISQSNYSSDFASMPQLFKQAKKTLHQARLRNVFYLSSADIITDYLEQLIHEDSNLQSLIHPAVHLLRETDEQQHTALLETLAVFLQKGQNITATAKTLAIHRNTMQARLDRIQELTGLDFHNPEELEALGLSILLVKPGS